MTSSNSNGRKVGAPYGNKNAVGNIRHGLQASQLPKGCKYIEHRCNSVRRTLENLLMEQKGEVSITDAATILNIIKWVRHGALCERWLRLEADKLKPLERIQYSKAIADAAEKADKAIRSLQLDAPPEVQDLKTYTATIQ